MRSLIAGTGALLVVAVSTAAAAAGGSSVPFPAGGEVTGKAAAHARAHLRNLEESLEACAAEASTCLGDEECLECMTSYVDHPVDYMACLEEYASDWSSATHCDVESARPCCANLMSRGNCLESGSFLEYWGCNLREFQGCEDYEMTCAGIDSSTSSPRSASSATSSPVADEAVEEEVVASEGNGTAAMGVPFATIAVATAGVVAGIAASATGADLLLLLQ